MSLPAPSVLVPHGAEALLLDAIDAVYPDGLDASLVPRVLLPAWMGPEFMAQAVSAFATWRQGPPYVPKPGLLLGLRQYRSAATGFARGARFTVSVRESTRDEAGSAVFDSSVRLDGRDVAHGMLTVYQPDDVLATLADQLP
jgi:predicted hotdog family 3-hydroxylacyl-ACP dehydratase